MFEVSSFRIDKEELMKYLGEKYLNLIVSIIIDGSTIYEIDINLNLPEKWNWAFKSSDPYYWSMTLSSSFILLSPHSTWSIIG